MIIINKNICTLYFSTKSKKKSGRPPTNNKNSDWNTGVTNYYSIQYDYL